VFAAFLLKILAVIAPEFPWLILHVLELLILLFGILKGESTQNHHEEADGG